MPRPVAERADRQHHRNLDEHADDRRQRCAGSEPEERDRSGHGQLKKVAGPDQGGGCGNGVRDAHALRQAIGEGGIEIDLDEKRHGDQRDVQGLLQNDLALERENDDSRGRRKCEPAPALDDNRSALREIAKIENAEEQLQKVQEIIKRQAKKQAKRDHVKKAGKAKADADKAGSRPAQRHPDDVILAELKTYCRPEFKKTWAEATTKVKRGFLREVLQWEGGKPLSEKD